MFLLMCNIICMLIANFCFLMLGNVTAGLIFLGIQIFFFIMQLITGGEV